MLQKFHSENTHITKPSDNTKKEMYSFIATKRPNLEILLRKFPYLPETMALETLKCLHPHTSKGKKDVIKRNRMTTQANNKSPYYNYNY
jgi:hypothetical protein